MKPYVFGLDGGGSVSRLRIADSENRTLAELRGEGINPSACGMAVVAERVEALFRQAFKCLESMHLHPADAISMDSNHPLELSVSANYAVHCLAGCAAVAGTDRPLERAEFEGLLRDRLGFSCPIALVSDPEAALVGGLGKTEGIILIAGTGSIAMARLADGRLYRSGGYGYMLGDEGSAFQIGFQAIARSLRSNEGRDLPTTMLGDLMACFELTKPQDFIPLVYRRLDTAAIARLAPLVDRFRESGDPLAVDIFGRSADELSKLVLSVYRQAGPFLKSSELLLWGGLLDNNVWLSQEVIRLVYEAEPMIEPRKGIQDASYGACQLALELGAKGLH